MAAMTTTSQTNAQLSNTVNRNAFTTRQPRARPLRSVVRAAKQGDRDQSIPSKGPSDMALKAVGALAAAQLALFPAAGPALAGKAPIKAATDVGEAAQSKVPEGAANPKTREERNTGKDFGIREGLNTIKERVDADNIVGGGSDIESGGRQNIFAPTEGLNASGGLKAQKGVSYSFDTGLAAPGLQVNVGNPVSQAGEAVKGAVSDNPLDKLKGKIDSAAITGNSPQRQLDQAGDKAKQTAQKVKQSNTAFNPQAGLMHTAAFGGPPQATTDKSDDLGNASFQGPEGNEGGITQPTTRPDIVGDSGANPKRGGDLKDSGTEFAAQNKGGRDEGTPGQTGATARAGANTPKGTNELRNPKTPVLPNALGGKNFLRDDSETPEETASGNIAKAQQSSGNAIDSAKKALGL